jgi:hypothetical protein
MTFGGLRFSVTQGDSLNIVADSLVLQEVSMLK